MARYAEKEAPLLERIIMQEGLERTKAEDWARDEITRLREEIARLREVLAPFVDAGNFKVFISTAITKEECFVSINVKERDLRRARAALKGENG